MSENKVQIVSVKQEEGYKVEKSQVRKGFFARTVYVLEDGREVKSQYFAERKKDVVAYLDKLPLEPKRMYALFNEEGKYYGTQQDLSAMMGWS